MKALVLAAGRGRRLRPLTASKPKCLLHIGSTTILEHQLQSLRRTTVQVVVIVCGHAVESVRRQLRKQEQESRDLAVRIVYNPFYSIADNLVSLWSARAELDDDLLLLNGDAVLHPRALMRLATDTSPCCLLLARKGAYTTDDMKVRLDDERVAAISKSLASEQTDAVAIGALRFSAETARRLGRELDQSMLEPGSLGRHFPSVIQRLIEHGQHVAWIDVGKLAWADVDTPADLQYVRQHVHLFQDHVRVSVRHGEA